MSGFDKARLGRLREVVGNHGRTGTVPGAITLVSRHGDTEVEVHGTGTPGGDDPLRRDSIFRISSMSKPITAVATLLLVEECRLRLDWPVQTWLPELADRQVLTRLDGPLTETVPANRPITVRDLLTFTLGFGMVFTPGAFDYPIAQAGNERDLGMGPPSPAKTPEPDEWLRRFAELPLMAQPGETWMYNMGSEVLSVLVARASGQSFPEFLAERIFAPLGMVDTGFFVPPAKLNRFVPSYFADPVTGAINPYDPVDGQWSAPPAFPSGAGGLVSTVDDYLAFARMLLAGGRYGNGERLLARPTVALMTSDQLTPAQKANAYMPGYFDTHSWGMGVSVTTKRDELCGTPGRYGWDGGFGTSWYNDPAEDLIGLLFTQKAIFPQTSDIYLDFWTSVYQAIDD